MPSVLLTLIVVAGVCLVLVGVGLAIARALRGRRVEAERAAEASVQDSDAELLDSSHIGFAPLVNGATLPPGAGPRLPADRK
jgi:hypothetical protein